MAAPRQPWGLLGNKPLANLTSSAPGGLPPSSDQKANGPPHSTPSWPPGDLRGSHSHRGRGPAPGSNGSLLLIDGQQRKQRSVFLFVIFKMKVSTLFQILLQPNDKSYHLLKAYCVLTLEKVKQY